MDLASEIKKLTEEKLTPQQFVVDVIISSKKGPKKVLVLIDGDQGVSIDDCAEISRHLSSRLDEQNLIDDNYILEVSTPGLDHPLKLKRQYAKNVGRSLRLKLQDQTIEGRLKEIRDDVLVLEQETGTGKKKEIKQVEVNFSAIEKAFVLVSFK